MSYVSSNTIGTLSSVPDGSIINHIFNFVSEILTDFKANSDENENSITNKLCISLNQHKPAEFPYFFHHQNIEDEKINTSTDFAVFSTFPYSNEINTNAWVKFEAKRLTTSLPRKREREYVIGEYYQGKRVCNSGGIERFKNERHGKDVKIAGLIGYLQAESFSYWLEKINGWIQNEIDMPHDNSLNWTNDDKLLLFKSETRIALYSSQSTRISRGCIQLRHLWISFV